MIALLLICIFSSSIPVYFIWLEYLSWFKFANELLSVNQWENIDTLGKISNTFIKEYLDSCLNIKRMSACILRQCIFFFDPNNVDITAYSLTRTSKKIDLIMFQNSNAIFVISFTNYRKYMIALNILDCDGNSTSPVDSCHYHNGHQVILYLNYDKVMHIKSICL